MTSATTIRVDPANRAQHEAWDGGEGAFWAAHAEQFDRSVSRYDEGLFEAASIDASDQVLDIGCGAGATTREAARRAPSGSALGLDLSAAMIAVATRVAAWEQLHNARFEQADVQVHPLAPASFDVALSRTGSMFFADPVAAFTTVAGALRPGGRLALLVWQAPQLNEWFTEFSTALAAGRNLPTPPADAPGPFSQSDTARVATVLTTAGFTDPTFDELTRPMEFGQDPDEAFRFVSTLLGWMLDGLDDPGRARGLAALRSSIDEHVTEHGVLYGSATWLVTATRS